MGFGDEEDDGGTVGRGTVMVGCAAYGGRLTSDAVDWVARYASRSSRILSVQ